MSRRIAFGLAAFALLALFVGSATLAAGTPPGTIYYQTWREATSGASTTTFTGYWSMNGDGTNKQPAAGAWPSRLLHGGRWFLSSEPVGGIYYPNNWRLRTELFATREDGLKVQLTNDPTLQRVDQFSIPEDWAYDDSFVSNAYVKWTSVPSGGNYTDAGGNQWLATAAIYKVPLDWSTGVPVAGAPAAALPADLWFTDQGAQAQFRVNPNVGAVRWSPTGDRVVYQQADGAVGGNFRLKVTSFDASGNATGTVTLFTGSGGYHPDWAPDGSRIAVTRPTSTTQIATIRPDGTGFLALTNSTKDRDSHPSYSPDGAYIAFTRWTQKRVSGRTVNLYNIVRVAAGGGSATDLTADVTDQAKFHRWR
jgi:Tol biopolymer transport system component